MKDPYMKRLRKPMRVAALMTHSCSFAVKTAAISLMSSEVTLVVGGREKEGSGKDKQRGESIKRKQRFVRAETALH